MKRMSLLTILLLAVPAAFSAGHANAMSLDQYLDMARRQNGSYQSQANQSEGARLLSREADLIFTPKLFAQFQTGYDGKLASPALINYDRAKTDLYQLGVSQLFAMGLEAKLSYNLTNTELVGADMTLLGGREPRFVDGTARLEVAMPFWKNGFGRGARADEEVSRQQAVAAQYQSAAQAASFLTDAEMAYWRLATAIEQVKIEEQSVKAAQNILHYVSGQNRKNLGERADVLQASAVVDTYSLQLQQAQLEQRAAQRNFNLYLNREAQTEVPALDRLDFAGIESIPVPTARPGDRPDVKAGEAQATLARATSTLANERNKPQLDLYGAYGTNGQAGEIGETISATGRLDRDTAYIGVKFSMPLNMGARSDAQNGALKNQLAADQNLRYLQYSQEQNWFDLIEKMSDAKTSLKLSGTIEQAHRAKLENERTRLRQGRTTTYQVLLFEQDYNRAQATRIRAAQQVLSLRSQAKLYQVPTNVAVKGGN